MPEWTASWQRTRVETETHVRRPNKDEIKEKAKDFRKKWSVVLGLHWITYIILFLTQMTDSGLDLSFTVLLIGFFSLFVHLALFIFSAASMGVFDRLMARLIGQVQEDRSVHIVEEGEVRVALDGEILSIDPIPASFTAVDRVPGVTEMESPQLQAASIDLDANHTALYVVQHTNNQTILEVRDTRSGERINLAGFQAEPLAEAPVIDRQPVVLSANDAATLRDELAMIRPELRL